MNETVKIKFELKIMIKEIRRRIVLSIIYQNEKNIAPRKLIQMGGFGNYGPSCSYLTILVPLQIINLDGLFGPLI